MSRERPLLYNTNGLAHHRLADAIDLVADHGFDGIALTPDVAHLDPFRAAASEVAAVAAHLARRGLSCSIQTGARYVLDPRRKHHPNLMDPDPAARAARRDFYRRCAATGRDLGATVLSFWSGAAPADLGREAGLARLAAECEGTAADCAAAGLRAALEPEPGMFVATVAEFDALRSRVRHPGFGLALDLGHVHCQREGSPAAILREHRDHLLDVQVEDMREGVHEHLPFGEGTLDLSGVPAVLAEIGFRGPVSVELSRDSHRAHAVLPAAGTHLRRLGF
ncbi:MAG: hypothetical protein HMLKMBBP_01474 [Planctomycetes bacterium]|nr:hypothetical protein [Planctomycetota bacterium]